ncbi:6-chlorohydroxyquinol-1,2-dioxygenase [Mesorhizobium sp. CGMCC 1.15528]|uniref:6-chlorohydroxyquinol-1,2-dioxygenase n=1 Tax=Mesorhizobium zhangyense TaxID=1776730 RepID=A0A7C9R9L0_9HYPH|nr:dioxygenase [Mesorhizobium zhangyense]NGN43601.1 6-chlorohydroxyquinol-1,2-dioxygenase [Mesorhizobium zhangyense]
MAALSFSENNSAEIVAERLARHSSGKLPKALSSLVDHLHRFIVETRPTSAEWRKAIEFLTEVGHASDQKRQEWVLMSDLLGITALVEEINSRRPKGATPNTVRGPFYRPDAPRLPLGANISLDGLGEPLEVSGHVIDLDGKPVSGAAIETWQANAQGFYENQQPDMQPEFNLRGVFTTSADGAFHYRTVKPAGYAVPCDGPVGQMLGAVGFPLRRPAHLHFIVKAEGFEAIRTHVYDGADPHLGEDALFGVKQELIGAFMPEQSHGRWSLDFTFVMIRARKERQSA